MIRYVPESDNILKSHAHCIVNTVNCKGAMGKGLALQFAKAYPAVLPPYKRVCANGTLRPGQLQLLQLDRKTGELSKEGNLFILNFPTKDDWREPARLEWIEEALEKLPRGLASRGITSIALPKLGAGLGGLPWEKVRDVIETHLGDLDGKGIGVVVHGEGRKRDLGRIEVKDRDVLEFQGADRHFSNMWPLPVLWGDAVTPMQFWPSNEVAYVAAKSLNPLVRAEVLETFAMAEKKEPGSGPFAVKKFGRTVALRPDWEEVKIPIMRDLVFDKADRHAAEARALIATGNGRIQEGNRWGDLFWGVALADNPSRGIRAGDGRNELGKIQMEARERAGRSFEYTRVDRATERGPDRER